MINEQKISPMPYWLPITMAMVFTAGAYINNVEDHGDFADLWMFVGWFSVLAVGSFRNRRFAVNNSRVIFVMYEPVIPVRIMVLIVIGLGISHYAQNGIPLLSADPDVARMEFMKPTIGFRVLNAYLPFLIIYLSSRLMLVKTDVIDWVLFLILAVLEMLLGGKAAFVTVVLLVYLGSLLAGTPPSKKLTVSLAGGALIGTLLFFKLVMGLSSLSDAIDALITRATSAAEYGLYITVSQVAGQFSSGTPFDFLLGVFDKYLGSGGNQFTPTLGRQVTAAFYGGDVYDFVWELTVTVFGDFYIFGRWPAVLVSYAIGYMLLGKLWKMHTKMAQGYTRALYVYLWFSVIQMVSSGSVVAQFVITILPFLCFWLIGYLFLRFDAALRHAMKSPTRLRQSITSSGSRGVASARLD